MNRLVVILLFLAPILARADENKPIAELYARGLTGDKQAVIDCIARLDAKLMQSPNDQLARVYLGSAWTLRSRDMSIGPGKLSALHKGIELMDQAAKDAPNELKVLLIQAVTNESLPGFLGRRKIAREQLEQLVVKVENDPAKLSSEDQQLLYLNAGRAAEQAGEKEQAHKLWQRGLAIAADENLSAELRAALAK
jgi:tetratricopeptide (TPR) repeat protein